MYADDTLIMDTDTDTLQHYMQCICDAGAEYGLVLNWKKTELLCVRHFGSIA